MVLLDNFEESLVFILIVLLILLGGVAYYEYHRTTYEYTMPYISETFVDEYARWDKPVVNLTVVGDCPDWDHLQDVMNEWNAETDPPVPRLSYNETYPDITFEWGYLENETWAGATWWKTHDGIIDSANITIRTSWDFSREHVIRHELGHAMGLSYHSNHPNSTMYKFATGVPSWSSEDLDFIEDLYT